MSGIFGVASEKTCTSDLFYGVDYQSHLGTQYGGPYYAANGFTGRYTIYPRASLNPNSLRITKK